MRQRPNLRRYPRGRPQIEQRLRCWVENLGFLFVLAIFAVVAILSFCYLLIASRNGIPRCLSSARAWLSSRAVVTMVTFMPLSLSTLA